MQSARPLTVVVPADRRVGRRPALAAGLVAAGLSCALAVFLLVGGGAPAAVDAALPDAGALVGWLLPLLRLGLDLTAAGTFGALLFAALAAGSAPAALAVRSAAAGAALWAGLSAASAALTVADIAGLPLSALVTEPRAAGWLLTLAPSRNLLVAAVLAGLVWYCAGRLRTAEGVLPVLFLAGAAVVPPVLTGHAATEGFHEIATLALVVHVLAACAWAGGLAALVGFGRGALGVQRRAAPRYSTVALGCFVAAGASGLVTALVTLSAGGDLLGALTRTGYGWLLLGKLAALLVLGGCGWWHRRYTLRRLASGDPGAFRRFAGVEVLVMAVTFALAVALSRTPTP